MSPALTLGTCNPDGSLTRMQHLFFAELAGEAERYNDVTATLKTIIRQYGPVLTLDERNLLSVAYKNLTNNLRNSWRIVDTLEKMQSARSPQMTRQLSLIQQQREKIEGELADVCKDIVDLLDKKLIHGAKAGEARVFYIKMKGDYYRYLAEFAHKRDRKDYAEKSLNAYKMAYMHALSALDPAHPTRLGLALNFSVFYHDVHQSPDRACHLAKSALDDAVSTFKQDESGACIVTSTTRDSLMILQLLRDDLVLWSSEMLEAEKRH